jgi:hypothetical protein
VSTASVSSGWLGTVSRTAVAPVSVGLSMSETVRPAGSTAATGAAPDVVMKAERWPVPITPALASTRGRRPRSVPATATIWPRRCSSAGGLL